jgi:large subunit ribosomal protein L7/L12
MLRSLHRAAGHIARAQTGVCTQLGATVSSLDQPSTSSRRWYAADDDSKPVESIGNEKVQKLAGEIMNLTVLESSWLSEILRKKLNIQKPAFGSMPMGMMPAMAAAAAPSASASPEAAAPAAEKKEKTEFEVKLESFSTEGKIKVIKEIRAITSLGLKEAKELVSALPILRSCCHLLTTVHRPYLHAWTIAAIVFAPTLYMLLHGHGAWARGYLSRMDCVGHHGEPIFLVTVPAG